LPENLAKITRNNQNCCLNNEAEKTITLTSMHQQIICKYDALITGYDKSLLRESFGGMLLEKAFAGNNVLVLAFGQSGSGKTFSMIGSRTGKFFN
jgi:hypothetical protein